MATEKEYVRLPGRGRSRVGFAVWVRRSIVTLWLGKDHLLYVDSSGYTEEYKRFYYRDIQALIIHKTAYGAIWNIVFGVLGAIFLALAAAVDDSVGTGILGFMAGIFIILVVGNALYGATCVCRLQTAVQTLELPSLRRLRSARKALARIRPLIESAQGAFEPPTTTTPSGETTGVPAVGVRARPMPVRNGPAVVHYHGQFHMVLFSLLFADAVLTAIDMVVASSGVVQVLASMVRVAELICLMGALFRQKDSDMPRRLCGSVWVLLGVYSVLFLANWIYTLVVSATQRAPARALDDVGLMVLGSAMVACCLGFGAGGLYGLLKFRREHQPPATPPVILGTGN